MKFSIRQIAEIIGGVVEGDENVLINNFAKIEEGSRGCISFLANPKYEHFIYTTESSVVIVTDDFNPRQPLKTNLIRVKSPYLAMSELMAVYQKSMKTKKTGVHEKAVVGESSKLEEGVYVDAFSWVGERCEIGENVVVYANAFIGNGVKIGKNTTIHAGVKIMDNCVVGEDCEIHPGAVIGSDGFGFAPDKNGEYQNVPQLGNVEIGDKVSIGSNTTIDRATMGSTRIKRGVKIDNLVQIAHNVEIGENTVIASQTGVSGSTKIGKNCIIAGQVGFVGHIEIADGTKFGAKSGVSKSIKEPNGSYSGHPLLPIQKHLRLLVKLTKL